MRIGSLKLRGELILAPMADYTNVAFRTLCAEYGASLGYTELISAKGLVMKSKKTKEMLQTSVEEKPVFLQLFGFDPKDFAYSVGLAEREYDFDGYDLNCGCSVPKAVRGNYGSSLMNTPKLIGEIIAAMRKETAKPVTLKIRLGLDSETFLDVAQEAQKAGADAIAIHARLGSVGYAGKANYEKIRTLKEQVSIPVIANGDIDSPEKLVLVKKETKCDAEMIGRRVMGNAFFFRQANAFLESNGKILLEKTEKDYGVEARRFFELVEEFELPVNDVRPYFIAWSRGLSGAPELRGKIGASKSIEEIKKHVFARCP